jgi:hypothetical protein
MTSEELYRQFEAEIKAKIPDWESRFVLSYEPTVTPGVFLGKVSAVSSPNRPLVKTDVRPEGVRLHFPVSWGDELSAWLGAPPADAYRLKSNWVNQPSIGVATSDADPYFNNLVGKVVKMLEQYH